MKHVTQEMKAFMLTGLYASLHGLFRHHLESKPPFANELSNLPRIFDMFPPSVAALPLEVL